MEWMLMPLRRYAEFTGRSRRKEYWMFYLFLIIVFIVLGIVENIVGIGNEYGYGPLSGLAALAVIIPSIAVGIRRLHDTDRTGWWLLISFLPIVGTIVLLVFFVTDGTRGANRFGPDPKNADQSAVFS